MIGHWLYFLLGALVGLSTGVIGIVLFVETRKGAS